MHARSQSGIRFLGEPALLRGPGHLVHRVPDCGVAHAPGAVPTRAFWRDRAAMGASERVRGYLQGGLGDPMRGAR
eukprot:4160097-Pyramimonas_sp.AAC.1